MSNADSVLGASGYTMGVSPALIDAVDPMFIASMVGIIGGKRAEVWNILGRRNTFNDTTSLHDIVDFAGTTNLIVALTGAETLQIISSSANDAAAGTGARTVRIVYLDTNNEPAVMTATMNGTTAVSLGAGIKAVQWMEVATVGSNEVAVGNIVIRNAAATTVEFEKITAGGNRSMSCRFQVPAGWTGYIRGVDYHAIRQNIDFRLRATVHADDRSTPSSTYLFNDNSYQTADTNSQMLLPWLSLPPLTKVKMSAFAQSVAGTPRADCSICVLLVNHV